MSGAEMQSRIFQQHRKVMGCSDVTGVVLKSIAKDRVQEDAELTASSIVVNLGIGCGGV
jgi:hypothetical protein